MIVTKPKDPTSASKPRVKSTPRKDAAAVGEVLPNQPYQPEAQGKPADPRPAIESSLVGKDGDSARPAASRKADEGEKPSSIPVTGPATVAKPDAAPDARPATPPPASAATPPELPEPRVVVRKAGFMPTFLGGVVAAGLGAAATYWAVPHLPPAWQPVPAAVPENGEADVQAAREAATQAARAEVQSARDDILQSATEAATAAGSEAARAVLAEAPAPDTPAPETPADQDAPDLAALEQALAQQADRLAALDERVAGLSTQPQPAPSPSTAGLDQPSQAGPAADPAALGSLQAALADLRGQVEAHENRFAELGAQPAIDPDALAEVQSLSGRLAQVQQEVEAAAQSAEQRLAEAQAEADRVREQTEQIARRASVATIAAGLQAALESGGSLQGGIAELQAAGVELPAAISADLPSLPYLQRDFDDAARAGLHAALREDAAGEDTLGAIGNFLRVQTGARSVEPREGGDPDAVLSRAAAQVRGGDIQAALAEIETLPPAGQDAMSAWTESARRWVDARAAIADLSRSVK